MAEEQKPVVAAETPVVAEPAPAVVPETPAVVETKTEEPVVATETPAAAETPAAEAAAPATEEKVTKVEKPVEPIYSGALGYKAPGLKNAFRFSKKYFWFGEEPVSAQSLSAYLRGEKPEVAQPTVAWSTQTGKGLLYFVKHADQKATPAGVLNLADVTDLTKEGTIAFHFKLHGHKHTFESSTLTERNGWYVAIEKAVADAKDAKKELVESAGYKEQLEKLGKPATPAVASASAKEATPKKSTDVKPTEPAPARTGSSSSSSSSDNEDKKKKKKASKSKSRSVSRGKRASVFGTLLGKKEKVEEKKEEKKEEKAEEKKAEEAEASTAAPAEPVVVAPVIAEVPKVEEPAAPVAETTEAPKVEEAAAPVTETPEAKPKPTKRGSIFGNFVEKLRSPTTEKKESEVAPVVPAKDTPVVAAEAPKIEEPVAPAAETAEAPKEEVKEETPVAATTPHKEKEHFSFSKFFPKEKAKSPTTEAPKEPIVSAEAPKIEEPVAETAEAPKEEIKKEEPVKEETTPTAHKAKRGSIFGNLTNSVKKEKTEGEASEPKKENKLTGLFRSASKSVKPLAKKEKEPAAPAKVEEKEEPKVEEAKAVEPTPAVTEPTAEPNIIGDVVPDAVTVGQAPKSTTEVPTAA